MTKVILNQASAETVPIDDIKAMAAEVKRELSSADTVPIDEIKKQKSLISELNKHFADKNSVPCIGQKGVDKLYRTIIERQIENLHDFLEVWQATHQVAIGFAYGMEHVSIDELRQIHSLTQILQEKLKKFLDKVEASGVPYLEPAPVGG